MTFLDQANIRARVLAKPGPVQVAIQMLAVKLSLEAPMNTGEEIATWMQAGADAWDEIVANFPDESVSEVQFAEALIERVRTDQKDGWGKILRGNAQ